MELLKKQGFNFFTGVTCSYFKPLCEILNKENDLFHIPAVREDIAVGLSVGAYLSGKMPVIYMQNSGLGYSLEAFASLHLIYYIPTLVLVSYRGPEDKGWEEHLIMGKHTEDLFRSFELKYSIFKGNITEEELKEIKDYLIGTQLPYFLLVTKGALE
ncbi:sulfopyruvate decarboxylase subunit alpha [Candidatus Aminicenantes bacterium AC-335-G13]|nr:sulfopyruvate decarboxylase subunit alpha [Candidatus Aminicenantes bacterium AC-335-G13]